MTPEVQAALNTISAALGGAAGAPVGPPVVAPWWRPTPDQTVAFAKRIGWSVFDLEGNRQANDAPTIFGKQVGTPKIPGCGTNEDDAKLYAAFGFDNTGLRTLWVSDNRDAARKVADQLATVSTAQAADNIIAGAGAPGVTMDLAIYLVMTGMTVGGGLLGSPRLYNAWGWQTLGDALGPQTSTGSPSGG